MNLSKIKEYKKEIIRKTGGELIANIYYVDNYELSKVEDYNINEVNRRHVLSIVDTETGYEVIYERTDKENDLMYVRDIGMDVRHTINKTWFTKEYPLSVLDDEMAKLIERYVDNNFVDKQYFEELKALSRSMRKILKTTLDVMY